MQEFIEHGGKGTAGLDFVCTLFECKRTVRGGGYCEMAPGLAVRWPQAKQTCSRKAHLSGRTLLKWLPASITKVLHGLLLYPGTVAIRCLP